MSLFIDEVVEENAKLKEEYKQLLEEYEILGEEWSKLLDDKISYSHLLQKYKKAIDILKKHIHADKLFTKTMDAPVYSLELKGLEDNEHYSRYNYLTEEEYEILKVVLGDE